MRVRSLLTPLAAVALLGLPGAAMAQSPATTPAKSTTAPAPAKAPAPAAAPMHSKAPAPAAMPAKAPAQPVMTVTEEKAGLLKEAKVQPAAAQKAALARVPNGTVTKAEIEKEHSKLIYSYDITVPGSSGVTEVHVDAKTGKVLSTKHEKAEPAASTAATKPAMTPAKPATASGGTKPATPSPTPAK